MFLKWFGVVLGCFHGPYSSIRIYCNFGNFCLSFVRQNKHFVSQNEVLLVLTNTPALFAKD